MAKTFKRAQMLKGEKHRESLAYRHKLIQLYGHSLEKCGNRQAGPKKKSHYACRLAGREATRHNRETVEEAFKIMI